MAFFEERLDPCITFGARGGPVFNTQVSKVDSGFRSANKNWAFPLHRYDVSQGIKSNADFETVRAFFYNVSGQFDGFRFKDWADFEAVQTNTSLTASGSDWQMQRKYVRGARTFLRPIYKPVSGTASIYRTRSSVVTTATATIDYATGLATITGHVGGDTYTWNGEFDVPVAFTSDVMEAEIVNRGRDGLLISWPSCQVEEIRL